MRRSIRLRRQGTGFPLRFGTSGGTVVGEHRADYRSEWEAMTSIALEDRVGTTETPPCAGAARRRADERGQRRRRPWSGRLALGRVKELLPPSPASCRAAPLHRRGVTSRGHPFPLPRPSRRTWGSSRSAASWGSTVPPSRPTTEPALPALPGGPGPPVPAPPPPPPASAFPVVWPPAPMRPLRNRGKALAWAIGAGGVRAPGQEDGNDRQQLEDAVPVGQGQPGVPGHPAQRPVGGGFHLRAHLGRLRLRRFRDRRLRPAHRGLEGQHLAHGGLCPRCPGAGDSCAQARS